MGLYDRLEEKYYEFLDWLDTIGIPLWKLAQPIEARGIPSFPIFALAALLILGGVGWGLYSLLFGPKVYLVTVLDHNGNPVPGAVVRVGKERYITGPDGTVEILLKGDESVWVLASGFKDVVLSPEDIQSSRKIVLEPETKDARIIITDTKGRRVDARVKVFGADRTYEFQGNEISFKLSRVPTEGAVTVGDNLTVRVEAVAEGYQKAVKTLSWNAPSITIRLKKKVPPSGTLHIRTDPPIDGWAYLLVGGSPVYSGIIKSGTGMIRGVEYGTYMLKIVPVVGGKKIETMDNVFTVTVNAPTVTQTYQVKIPDLNKLVETVIRVVDANTNKPITALVTIKETNARYTAHNGTLTIHMKAYTTFTVTVSATKYYPQTFKISAGEEKTVSLVRMPATGSVVVTVVDVHGNPIQGAQVSLLTENEEPVAEGNATDADGKTVFREMGVGKYIAEACKGAICARSDVFELKEDEIKEVRITLAPGHGSVYVVLRVGGVPAPGTVRAVRSDTGDVLARTEIGIDGEGYLENIPAYVEFYVEVQVGGITYVSTRMRLLPNEAKRLSIDLEADPEEGFRILGMYVGDRKVGIIQGGKTYAARIWYACRGLCSQTFHILNGVGVFRDTDFPGDYTITVDGNNPSGEGAYLEVSLECNGLCVGEFSAEVFVSPVATFGDKLTIEYGDSAFSAPIAWEGSCGDFVCASLYFEREGEPVDPLQLYEEVRYDLEIDVLWGGEEIPYGKIVISAEGPADVNLQDNDVYVYKGHISYGTFLRVAGSIYSESSGPQEFTVAVSSCDASYTNCQEVDTYTIEAYFNEEVGRQLIIVSTPDFFMDCPNFPIRIQLLDEEGAPVDFDPNTMQLDVMGYKEVGGVYIPVRLNVEQNGDAFLVTLENPAEFEYVLVRADGFNYDTAEVYAYREDLALEIEALEEGVGFTAENLLTVPAQIADVSVQSPCIESISWDAFPPTIEPGETSTVYITPTFSQPCEEAESTLTVEFAPLIDETAWATCTVQAQIRIIDANAPQCIRELSAEQIDIDKVKITFKNECAVDISTAQVEIDPSSTSHEVCDTCFSCGELQEDADKTYWITCTYSPPDEYGGYAEMDLTISILATFESGAQESADLLYSNFVYVDEGALQDCIVFEPAENINPNSCPDQGVFIGTVKKDECYWLEMDASEPTVELGGYTYLGVGEGGGSEYDIYLPTTNPEEYLPAWYAPFVHGGDVSVSVTVDVIILSRKIPMMLSGEAHAIEGDVQADSNGVTNKTCGPILLKIAAEDQQATKVVPSEGGYSPGALLSCPGPENICDLFTPDYSSYTEAVYIVYDHDKAEELTTYELSSDEIQEICLSRIPKPIIQGKAIVLAVGSSISPDNWPTDTDLVVYTPDKLEGWESSRSEAQHYPHVLAVAGEGLCVAWYDDSTAEWKIECHAVNDITSGATYKIASALESGTCDPNDPPIKTLPAQVQVQTDGTQFACQVIEPTGDYGYALDIGKVNCAQDLKDKVPVWVYGQLPAVSEGYWGEQSGVLWYIDKSDAEMLELNINVAVFDVSAEYNSLETAPANGNNITVPTAKCAGGSADLHYAYFRCDQACIKFEDWGEFAQDFVNANDANYYIVATCVPGDYDSNYFNNYIVFYAAVQDGTYCWWEFDPENGESTIPRGGPGCPVNNPPTITSLTVSPPSGPQGTEFTITCSAEDDVGLESITIEVPDVGSRTCSVFGTSADCTYTVPSSATQDLLGEYNVFCTAKDTESQTAQDTTSFTVCAHECNPDDYPKCSNLTLYECYDKDGDGCTELVETPVECCTEFDCQQYQLCIDYECVTPRPPPNIPTPT